MPILRLTWHCKRDALSCPVCRALDGYSWKFTTEKDKKLPDVLVHPVYGAVWSLKEDSLIKEENGKCRCEITREIDLSDMVAAVRKIRDKLAAKYGFPVESKTRSHEKIPDKQYFHLKITAKSRNGETSEWVNLTIGVSPSVYAWEKTEFS